MIFLVLAKGLVRTVPLRYWRSTLGRIGEPRVAKSSPAYRDVRLSVIGAAERLPGDYVCLPRAMAVQWMLRRRGLVSAIVLGVAPAQSGERRHALHAWVEAGGRIVIGEDPANQYARGLVLVQP